MEQISILAFTICKGKKHVEYFKVIAVNFPILDQISKFCSIILYQTINTAENENQKYTAIFNFNYAAEIT